MSEPLMFMINKYEYSIKGRKIILLSEYHQEFHNKIKECKKKGYITVDEFVNKHPGCLVLLELSNMLQDYVHTYSTNLNILQKMKDVDKMHVDLRFNISKNYQNMYELSVNQLTCKQIIEMIDFNLNVVKNYHKQTIEDCNGYSLQSDTEFIYLLIQDAENNINLLQAYFCEILKQNPNIKLSELDRLLQNPEFMELTNAYEGYTISERVLEIIKHSWKKITDICIMIVFLTSCTKHTTIIALLGGEHVDNLNYIIKLYFNYTSSK